MGKTTYPPGATFCRTCGYCLFGLPSNICPECGHAFDPADPATFLARPRRRGIPRAIFWGVLVVLVLGLAYGGFLAWLYVGWRAEAGARAVPTGPSDTLKTRSILPAALSHLLFGDCRQWQERVYELKVYDRPLISNDIHSIAACRRLKVLWLIGMPLKTQDVAEVCGCEELGDLRLVGTGLHGGDLAPIGRLVHLKMLTVGQNKVLGDEDFAPIWKLNELEELNLFGTAVTDEGMAHLLELSHLQKLYLHSCPNLTDACVPHLSRLSGLKELYLWRDALPAAAIAQLRKNLPGCKVEWP